ncbi:aldehyde dehydrogenase family protein [Varunaivibrio sulfuroxidans]|uniref:Aldehyde dehydrogenase (NAD+) n=1 Tax=Varunaivibrio sulfuroxidans TaxID=1773489 RepID=A0A4R3JFL9_9PROT|nr:aldehyde dehydrogenase family protein [Varunaivibrio sulfuroxidans]TCS63976.1 aldehyde dehydrogenase (NAD+) [Varunaivibrio sulfuroxidans]WES31571.1 aldehyde dehydrogenase family protein [Varunaivibrio sulfuroxidans]
MDIVEILNTMEYGPAPEDRGPADTWLESHKRTFGHFIDGKWSAVKGGAHFETCNPATGEVLASIAQGGDKAVGDAVRAARRAQPGWAALGGAGRARHLYALARLVQKHARILAVLETLDNGKPIRESRDIDVPLVARHFYHHAGWAQLIEDEFPAHRPLGVIGQIVPWNFPLLMLAWKIAPALAAGNTVVLKPAEYTPLTALRFAEICAEAGLPAGVVNIVTGDGRTGALLVENEAVDKIAFTGSTEVGRIIRQKTAGSGKKLSLELGGKSPFIVFDDADLDSAVEGVVDAIWFNQGQVCCAGSRLLIQEGVAARFTEKLKARMETLRVGDPLDKCTDIGAIVDARQLDGINEIVGRSVAQGARLWQPAAPCPSTGIFYPPTLLEDVTTSSIAAQEEIFGPVLAVMTFRTPEEAVALANNTRYGLAASVWSENINLALGVAPAIKAGSVWINSTNMFDAAVGFGGYRQSGFGREGGREGMAEYLRPEPIPSAPKAVRAKDAAGKTKPISGVKRSSVAGPSVDRTAKLYIGGKQVRPDGGYSRPVPGADGAVLAEVGEGNRKDIRNAVEAARKAAAWGTVSGHGRAQILYYIAENLSARADEFARRLQAMGAMDAAAAEREVADTLTRLFYYAAWADKFDGAVHTPPIRGLALAVNEPVGILALSCPDGAPLLGFVSMLAPAIAMGNRVVITPSARHPLSATDFYQVLETSDVPAGVVNIVTGDQDVLAETLAAHEQVDGMWYFGAPAGMADVERLSAGNMKRTWVLDAGDCNFSDRRFGLGRRFLDHGVEVKNIWVPFGE